MIPARHLVALIGLVASPVPTRTQEPKGDKPVTCSVVLLTEMNLAPLVMDVETVGPWLRPIIEGVEARLIGETTRRDVVVQVVLHRDGPPDVVVAGRPALAPKEEADLRGLIDPTRAPHSKVADFAFRVVAKVNGGEPDPSAAFTPRLVDPFAALVERFKAADTVGRAKLLRDWADRTAVPLLGAAASSADPKFAGVVALGRALTAVDPARPIDVAALTERSGDFWRATLEMEVGNPLTAAAWVALLCGSGQFDRARRVSEIAAVFDANKSGPSRLLGEFRTLHGIFDAGVNARIGDGIKLHDAGEFARAIAAYDAILADDPASAWAHYERFQSLRALRLKEGKPMDEARVGWPEAKAAILAADPLYASMAEARGKAETYELLRRAKIGGLFKDKARRVDDLLDYAEIAAELGQDGYAALIHWYGATRFPEASRRGLDLIEEFLHDLGTLGVGGIADNFEGDHAASARAIDARRAKARADSVATRAVADPEED